MNVKEYISSGAVESYVLGIASDAERAEFEDLLRQYPEIVQARNNFEIALETQLLSDAMAPPEQLKTAIAEKLKHANPEYNTTTPSYYEEQQAPVRRMNIWSWAAAALFILLAGTAYWAYTVNNKYSELKQANATLQKQNNEFSTQVAELEELKRDAQVMQNPGVKMASLQGTAIVPKAHATVYWDTTGTRDVYLLVNNMPKPASDKQYQLWALLDGKPIDLGVFDFQQKPLLVKMKNVQQAQAFAITLEPKGGSVNPTMDAMYVVGKL